MCTLSNQVTKLEGIDPVVGTVVFDFDGTVADTLPICYYAFQQVFQTYDQTERTISEIQQMFGPSEAGIIQQNVKNQMDINAAVSAFYRHYEERHQDYVRPFAPIHALLADMRDKGLQIAIFTGKGRKSLDISLKELNLSGLFDIMVTGDDVIHPKPHPEGLHHIMTALGCRPNNTIMVGDSDADVEAAIRAEVTSIRADWMPRTSPENFHFEPDHVFTEVDQLRRFLEL